MSAHIFTVYVPGYYHRTEIIRTERASTMRITDRETGEVRISRGKRFRDRPAQVEADFRAWMDTPPLKRELMEVES